MTQSISDSEEWFPRDTLSLVISREQIKQISLNVNEKLPVADGVEVSPSAFSCLKGAEGQVLPSGVFKAGTGADDNSSQRPTLSDKQPSSHGTLTFWICRCHYFNCLNPIPSIKFHSGKKKRIII